MESDHRYYSRRAAEEHWRAARAITPEARERHRELARVFASKAQQLQMQEQQLAGWPA